MKERLITIFLSVATTYGLLQAGKSPDKVLEVDRLIVRKELIVSDTGQPWEKGYEQHQIPRGIYARALHGRRLSRKRAREDRHVEQPATA